MLDSLDTLIAFVTIMLVVSMLITIAVQILAALLNLRGMNLAKGLVNTLNTILPQFEKRAAGFADCLLSGRLLSDTGARRFGRRATAVRPDEIFDAINRIATGRREAPADLRDDARRLLKGLGLTEEFLDDAEAQVAAATGAARQLAGSVQQLRDAATATIAHLPEDQQVPVLAAIRAITDRLDSYETVGAERVEAVAQAVDAAYKKFQYWFEVGQERAQQWFASHTRWITIALAIIFAFWLQLDTVEIFQLVSSNRAVRDSLVAQSVVVTRQAEKLLGDSQSVLEQGLKTWRDGLTEDNAKKALEDEAAALTDSRGSLRGRIQKKLAAAGVQGIDVLLSDFDSTIDKTAWENLKDSTQQFSEVKSDLDKTGFALFPPDGKGRWGDSWCDHFCDHVWGMIFSAALLSLGAPFWFNALKGLASLRSKVADNISTEQKGDRPPPGTTPPTAKAGAPATIVP